MLIGISGDPPLDMNMLEGMVSKGVCVVRQAPVMYMMAPPIHLGVWSMAMAAFIAERLHVILQHTVSVHIYVCLSVMLFYACA